MYLGIVTTCASKLTWYNFVHSIILWPIFSQYLYAIMTYAYLYGHKSLEAQMGRMGLMR